MTDFIKYPRTPHLAGSKLQDGDHDLEQVAISSLTGGAFVWEEKVDGANAAFSFLATGEPQLQSRGHVLRGGAREAQFNLFKAWVETHQDAFRRVIGTRYIVYGEWCFAKHTVFYDRLPHYFLEFDVLDCLHSTAEHRNFAHHCMASPDFGQILEWSTLCFICGLRQHKEFVRCTPEKQCYAQGVT